MVANFLRTLDWHSKEDLCKHIINFYTKSKSYDKLIDFYESKALIEIDDYRDYERGYEALIEAQKLSTRINVSSDSLEERIGFIKRFLDIQIKFTQDPIHAFNDCVDLLEILEKQKEVIF